MEINSTQKMSFHGSGGTLFGIQFVNILLMIVTLGFYYPWAKAATLRYMYQETEFIGSRFSFHGTGKEIFKGFIKTVGILLVLYGIYFGCIFSQNPVLLIIGLIIFLGGFFLLIPLIIHGSMRYRMSRSSWRGIHFGYRGIAKELVFLYYKDVLLTLITLGIYGPWMTIHIRQYVFGHVRFGNVKFNYKGNGMEYLILNLKGILLTIVTFGIYAFWYSKDIFNYYINNLEMQQEERVIPFKSTATGGGFFGLLLVNALIVMFTFGFGAPWATVRMMNYIFSHIEIGEGFNADVLLQTEENYTDALGDDMFDALDLDIV